MNGSEAIIKGLIDRQVQLKEPDGSFAKRLGISRQAWQMIRTGDSGISAQTLQKVASAFPDLAPSIMALFMPEKASMLTSAGKSSGADD
jgi:hypothetical protein